MDVNKPVMWPTTNPVVIFLALPITLFLILFGIWGIVALKSHLNAEASASHQADVAERIADTPPAYNLSPFELLDAYHANADAAIDQYQGQVIRITGTATGVTEPKKGNFMAKKTAAYVNFVGTTSGIRCLLPDDDYEAIRALPGYPRPSLQLVGVVQHFDPKFPRIRLEGCHL